MAAIPLPSSVGSHDGAQRRGQRATSSDTSSAHSSDDKHAAAEPTTRAAEAAHSERAEESDAARQSTSSLLSGRSGRAWSRGELPLLAETAGEPLTTGHSSASTPQWMPLRQADGLALTFACGLNWRRWWSDSSIRAMICAETHRSIATRRSRSSDRCRAWPV